METKDHHAGSVKQKTESSMHANGNTSAGINVPFEELEVQDQVGGGGFSLVYRGMWNGCPVAIKKWFDPHQTDQLMAEFMAEVLTLAELKHPNVVQFLGASMKPPNLCLLTEYLPHSLCAVLYQSNIELAQSRIVSLAIDMVRGLRYLHSRKPPVIHRDLKPSNVLLDRSWKVKLCDFGLASSSTCDSGTPQYMAPELLLKTCYNEKVDVYAFGILLNEMVSRRPPFEGLSFAQLKTAVCNGERPPISCYCHKKLEEIIQICWSPVAVDRPRFSQIQDLLKEASTQLC